MLHTKNYDPIAHHAELDQQRGKAEYQHECDREWQRSLEKNYKPKIPVPDMKVIPTIVIYCAESHGYYQFDSQSALLYERALDKAIQEQWTLKRLVQILESGHRYPLAKMMIEEHKLSQEGGRKYDWIVELNDGTKKPSTYRGACHALWRQRIKSISRVGEMVSESRIKQVKNPKYVWLVKLNDNIEKVLTHKEIFDVLRRQEIRIKSIFRIEA